MMLVQQGERRMAQERQRAAGVVRAAMSDESLEKLLPVPPDPAVVAEQGEQFEAEEWWER